MARSLHLTQRRVRQTVRVFDNGWQLLSQIVSARGETLTFRLPGGARISCPNHPGARVPVYEVFAEDAYGLADLLSGVSQDGVVLDIGAHIGCFSVAVALRLPDVTVHAYEASPATAQWLTRNVAANQLEQRVSAHPIAISAERGSLSFADNACCSSLNGLTAPPGTARVTVAAITFGDAVRAAGGRVDVVKIDTEGAEYSLILGSEVESWRTVRSMVIEYHDVPGHDWTELERHLGAAGLQPVRHQHATPRQGTVWLRRSE